MPASATKKTTSRPGRKPLTTEPKNKRTAQNRAAQRAFRERKERKMRELENKVKHLEDEKMEISNETELLRSQVKTLLEELSKFRGGDRPTGESYEQAMSSVSSVKTGSPSSGSAGSTGSSPFSVNSGSVQTSMSSSGSFSGQSSSKFQFPTTWGNLNQESLKGDYDEGVNKFCAELSSVCGSKECPIPKAKQQELGMQYANSPAISSSGSGTNASPLSIFTPQSSSDSVSINTSSSNLTSADMKTDPVGTPAQVTGPADDSQAAPFFSLLQTSAPASLKPSDEMNFLLDSMSFKTPNTAAFTTSPGFNADDFFKDAEKGMDDETMGGMVTESSKYDPLDDLFGDTGAAGDSLNIVNTGIIPQTLPAYLGSEKKVEEITPHAASEPTAKKSEGSDEVVPDNTGKLMKCSQIWERITSHPRFSETDIDGLCEELKQKAKCSEKGVVVDGGDVGKIISETLDKSEMKENRFLKGLAC